MSLSFRWIQPPKVVVFFTKMLHHFQPGFSHQKLFLTRHRKVFSRDPATKCGCVFLTRCRSVFNQDSTFDMFVSVFMLKKSNVLWACKFNTLHFFQFYYRLVYNVNLLFKRRVSSHHTASICKCDWNRLKPAEAWRGSYWSEKRSYCWCRKTDPLILYSSREVFLQSNETLKPN